MRKKKAMGGFSLVELMVAMTMSLILMAGALSILYSSRVSYTENERLARIQEAGRTTIELLMRDLRAAGFQGCSRPILPEDFTNGLMGGATLLWNLSQPVSGFEANGGVWAPALDAAVDPAAQPGSDILAIRTTRVGMPVFRTNAMVPAAGLVSVDRDPNATIPAGTKLVIGDCDEARVFSATAFTPAGATATIAHAQGGAPGDNANGLLPGGFQIGAQVTPLDTVIYYVAPSTSGLGPALWQQVGNTAPQLLIEGVENLQFLYGVDTNANLVVDAYQTAAAVANWDNVISVSLAALIRSEAEAGLDVDAATYNLLGQNVGPFNDRRQRTIFSTTVALRNRTR